MSNRTGRVLNLACALLLASTAVARAADKTYATGSYIVPTDLDYQDQGMLRAYGLVYALLRAGVTVDWVIRPAKPHLGIDFTASAVDRQTSAPITAHGYRGGPFVISATDVPVATSIVAGWQAANPTVKVHVTTAPFTGFVKRRLVAAPNIAVFADGNELIAFRYLNSAGIPDSKGQTWPATKDNNSCGYAAWPDVLCETETAGGTVSHSDGKLFDGSGQPAYCQMMSMHWAVADANTAIGTEVVAEYRAFLQFPVHLFAECQAVNAIENNVNGKFLTPNGFLIASQPTSYDFYNDEVAFSQLDGPFKSVGGSEPSYSLPAGNSYLNDVVMISGSGDGVGVRDVWMTGYAGGGCPISSDDCTASALGKVSYLGGHDYSKAGLPISAHNETNGVRLFLNSLLEADCGVDVGQPAVTVTKDAPRFPASAMVTFTVSYRNSGAGMALGATLEDPLPAGAVFISASNGGTWDGTRVNWTLGTIAPGRSGSVTVTVMLSAPGTYANQDTLRYSSGVTPRTELSNSTLSTFGQDQDGDGLGDADEVGRGTDPNDADSDDDGVSDGLEVLTFLTNPLLADTDNDGLQDGTELGFVGLCTASCHTPARCATASTGAGFVPDADCSTTTNPNDPTDPARCGDLVCNGTETCSTCSADCGPCPPRCGDGTCNGTDTCSNCPGDCGICPISCGNGTCDMPAESCSTCPADCNACPPTCGDGSCNGTETCSSCAGDCGPCAPRCGDGTCNGTETCSTCVGDCGACAPRCGDALCNGTETCTTCVGDCGPCAPRCGDGLCNGTETCTTCVGDCGPCPPSCGDGACNGTETCATCAGDCGACPRCGDGLCNGSEACSTCPGDCGTCMSGCGNGICEAVESCTTCGSDCGACAGRCGDGLCDSTESCTSCVGDCGACSTTCGDGNCSAAETCASCAADCSACAASCGNGVCEPGELCGSCSSDCGSCSGLCGDGVCDPLETCASCPAECAIRCPAADGGPTDAGGSVDGGNPSDGGDQVDAGGADGGSPDASSGDAMTGQPPAGQDSGCGCRTSGRDTHSLGGLLSLAGVLALLLYRRSRRPWRSVRERSGGPT
ncbi:MAG: DUF11 domain-containing protein [Deltaproteobacteria bacterium]|nr:DUF11 domain-containing protein [Deltaproteobacteria bacterium]